MKKTILLTLFLVTTGCINNSLTNSNLPANLSSESSDASNIIQIPSVTPIISSSSQPSLMPVDLPINAATAPPVIPTMKSEPYAVATPDSIPIYSAVPSTLNVPPVTYEGATQIDTLGPSGYLEPLISMNSQGNFALAYTKIRKGEANYDSNGEGGTAIYSDIYARTFNKSGNPISAEIKIKEESLINSIDIDDSDNFIVNYGINEYIQTETYLKKYDINGIYLNENLINKLKYFDHRSFFFNAKTNSAGESFVNWITAQSNPNPYVNNLYKPYIDVEINIQRYDSSLKPISDIQKYKIQSDNLVSIYSKFDKNDDYYISWSEAEKINVIKFDKDGKLILEKLNLVTNNTDTTYHNIIIDNEENFIISWIKKYELNAIYLRKYDKELKNFKEERVSFDSYSTDSYKPSLTVDSSDNITVTWLGTDRPNGNTNVLSKRYDRNLKPITEETLINKLSNNRGLTYTNTDKDNNLYIFFRSQEEKLYLKKYDKNGNLLK